MKVVGKLTLTGGITSFIENLRPQPFVTLPTWTSGDEGKVIYVTGTDSLYYGTDTQWYALATGGNAAALQDEVDAIEASLGAGINTDGTFLPNGFTDVTGVLVDPTSFTDAINQVAAAVNSNNELSELDDVTITGLADNDLLQYNSTSTQWENVVIGAASGVQGYDAGLAALAAFNTNGIVVQTADNTFAGRSLVQPAAGITITDGDGVAGNPTFALANDLAALEGLATNGYVVRTGDGTATTRSISGTAGNIDITNGDGVASNTSVNLATVTQGTGGSLVKVTLDTFGRVIENDAVVAADITALVDAVYVNVSGDTMDSAANLVFAGGGKVTGLPSPTADTDAANKAYVDALQNGLSWKQAVRAATTGNVAIATALENGDTLDGVTLVTGDRVLVKDQTAAEENGIYVVQATGAAVRALDMNDAAEFDGAAVFVKEGTANEGSGWTQTATVATVGTDTVSFSQFTGGALYTWGIGLSNSGNTINVNLGAGIIELPSDEVGIDLYDSSTGALILTADGSTRGTLTGNKLHLLLDGAGALAQGAGGLRINAASVTNAMLVNDSITTNADTGTDGDLALGGTLEIAGSSVQGIATAVAGSVFTISGVDASDTQKGVASFDTSHFSVTAGAVSLAASLDDLTNVSTADAAATDDVLSKSAGDWVPVSRAAIVGSTSVDAHNDVTLTAPAAGDTLINVGGQFVNRPIYFLYDGASNTTHVVEHNLGQQYCNVTVVESATDEVVIPQSITFDDANQLTVVFNTAVAAKVVVMGVNAA